MDSNRIRNGDFTTGNFEHWTVNENDGTAKVMSDGSGYRARITLGKNESVRLATDSFSIRRPAFKLSLEASMPEPGDEDAGTMLYCTLAGYGPSLPIPIILTIPFTLSGASEGFEYMGEMRSAVTEVQLTIALAPVSNPKAVGPIYLDNVKYTVDLSDKSVG
ncbi:hypothetical protein D3C85_1231110 [compost metagenome]|uniref:hypothetical protein n=1 Tax=Pseudomonas fluorescens TaxID=294 RepID=UPI000FAA6FE5|nr:hypothetical protein [Pseudomonas fluorescens]VVP78832.1 hypothetical protein PS934_00504 [Pseudomonas fluorescens]